MIGRSAEAEVLDELLRGVRSGRGGCLVVLGEAGIGKSTVLEDAAARAEDLVVVRIGGVQTERDIPFAGLHALVAALHAPTAGVLSEPQREALDTALGERVGASPSRLHIGTATLGLLAAQPPTVVLVDDLQWVDEPSAEAFAFAARRLLAERVAVVFAVRSGEAASRVVAGLPSLELGPLTDATGLLPDVAAPVADRLRAETRGNPLAMVEAAARLTDDERAGRVALGALPETNPEMGFAQRLDGLDPHVRSAVRVAALAGSSPVDVQVRALATVGAATVDLDVLVEQGIAEPGVPVRWRHPLARSAAARGTPDEVRTAHRALADAWEVDTPARAWHLAGAATGLDHEAATALAEVARTAESREASAEAGDAWEAAARLTPDDEARTSYTESAARAALRAGRTERAAVMLDEALVRQPDQQAAARLLWQRGRVQHALGDPLRELEFFVRAQELSDDRDLRVWACAEAVFAAMYADRPDEAQRMATLLRLHHDPTDPAHRFLDAHSHGSAAALNGDPAEARHHFDRARSLLVEGLLDTHPALLLWAVNLELFDPVVPRMSGALLAAIDDMRRAGDMTWLTRVTHLAASRHELVGDWEAAEALTEECALHARMSGQWTQLAEALYRLTDLAFLRGDTRAGDDGLRELESLTKATSFDWIQQWCGWLRAFRALTDDDHATAIGHLEPLVPKLPEALPVLAGCLVRRDGPAAARAEISRWPDLPTRTRAVAAAVVDDPAELARLATEESHPADRALLHLWAGEGLRRAGDRVHARAELRTALDLYQRLRATPWAARADAELRASGATLRRTDPGSALTASEQRVAGLVAEGMSNKEVAATLFLSPKTVEFHLGQVYRKLGVRNRTALAAALRS